MRNSTPALGSLLCCVTMLAACGKSDASRAADSAAAMAPAPAPAPTPAPTPAAVSLADIAGKWNMRSVPESGDTTSTSYVLTASADSSGWKMTFPNGLVVSSHAMASGDSIVSDAGPYASVRRKGVQVTTHSVLRRKGAGLVGTTIAHYKTTAADSVLRLHSEGTRAP